MGELHLWATYLIVVLTFVGFAWERFSLESVALAGLAALLLLFSVFPHEALTPDVLLMGFANPALATVLALLIVGQALFATDAMEMPARFMARIGGASGFGAIAATLLAAMLLSAVLNNTPVVVMFIPLVTLLAVQRNLPAAAALMPLSYLSILGGITTLIGSSTNLLAAGVAADSGVHIGFFSITVPGLFLAAAGAIYVFAIMPRMFRAKLGRPVPAGLPTGAHFIGEITLTEGHPFLGLQSNSGLFPGLQDLMPRLVVRRSTTFFPPFEDIVLSVGDKLVVSATRKAFTDALARGRASIAQNRAPENGERSLPRAGYQIAEAVVTPGSRHAGRTVRNAGIETIYGVDLIAVQRKSRMGRVPFPEIRLEPGDTVLVGGSEEALQNLRANHDLILLEWSAEHLPQRRKARIAIAVFAAIVLCGATGILPIASAAIIGAFAMIASGCLTMQQAARAFDRQIFLLVGASIAAATALEQTGGAMLAANAVVRLFDGFGPAIMLSGFFAIIAVLTNILSNNATAVLFTPIGIGIANAIGAPPEAFVAAVIFAANASFATPIGYQTNLLVMGPGDYRFSDFIKAGTPLVIIIWLTFSFVGPWYYDF